MFKAFSRRQSRPGSSASNTTATLSRGPKQRSTMASPPSNTATLPKASSHAGSTAAPALSLDPPLSPHQSNGQANHDYFLQKYGETSPKTLGQGHPSSAGGEPSEQMASSNAGGANNRQDNRLSQEAGSNGHYYGNGAGGSADHSRDGVGKDSTPFPRSRNESTASRAGSISRRYGRTVSTISTQRTRLDKGAIDMSQAIVIAPSDDPRPPGEFHVRSGDNKVYAVHKANITTNSGVFRDVMHQHDAATGSRGGADGEVRAKEEGMRLEERSSVVEPMLQCLYPIPVANIREEDLFDFLAASSKYGIQRGIELALAWIAIALHARISQGGSTSLGYWQNLEKKNLLQFWLAHSENSISQPISQLVQGAFEEALLPWCHYFEIPTGPISLSDMLSESQYRRLNFEDYAKLERTVRDLERRRESLAVGTTA